MEALGIYIIYNYYARGLLRVKTRRECLAIPSKYTKNHRSQALIYLYIQYAQKSNLTRYAFKGLPCHAKEQENIFRFLGFDFIT